MRDDQFCLKLVFPFLNIVWALFVFAGIITGDSERMGQRESAPGSPLDCLLKNFSDFQRRARGYGGPLPDPEFLRTLSQLEWPAFDVGWPSEGTFDLPVLFAVRATVYRVPHPDQFLYIDVWVDIATERPGYIRKCLRGNGGGRRTLCLAAGVNQRGCERRAPSRDPSVKQPPAAPRLYPVLPGQPEDPLDPVVAPPPYNRRMDPDSSLDGGGTLSPPHTRGGAQYGGEERAVPSAAAGKAAIVPPGSEVAILPLREAQPGPDAPPRAPPRLIYVPFSTSDLYNWKHQNSPFSERPQGLISLLETIFRTHQPTWDDCQQILQTLFTSEERDRIIREAGKAVMGEEGETAAGRREIEDILPSQPPNWDPNSNGGREALLQYRRALLRGLKAAARKPTNFSKVSEVIQGREESPAAFLERLMEAYRVYTPLDPEAEENRIVNIAFVTQAASDIRRKLQKIEGFEGENRSKLLEIAQKVYVNRDDPEIGRVKEVAKILLATQKLPESGRGRQHQRGRGKGPQGGRLGKDQCAYCKEHGHWRRDCPKRRTGNKKQNWIPEVLLQTSD